MGAMDRMEAISAIKKLRLKQPLLKSAKIVSLLGELFSTYL
jgi:hypothetical protein